MTVGDQNVTTPTIQKPAGAVTIDTKTAGRYIEYATQHIDSRLRPFYVVPLRRVKALETNLIEDAAKGSTTVRVYDCQRLSVGNLVRFSSGTTSDLHEIKKLPEDAEDVHTVELSSALLHAFSASTTKVSMIEFPDPLPILCARLACGTAIDRQFVAEQEPDVSTYGKTLRTLVSNDIDMILTGVIRLEGQDHVGRRFLRTQLLDTWKSPVKDHQTGIGKET
jgi:hypothetical protein